MRVFLPLAALAAVAQPAPLPIHVGGRVTVDPAGGVRFGWPGVYVESSFRGTGVRVRFDAPTDFLRLLIDGEEKAVFKRAGLVDATLEGLPEGAHVVRLEKLTESQQGGTRFIGFFPTAGDEALPAPARERQIEFIGDSYTVGYGDTSAKRACTRGEVHDRTDTQQAFGPLVARHFDADYRINAYSGFGVVRNYDGTSPGLSLPVIYPRLKPDDPAALDTAAGDWRPQLIVINLGTNDFSTPVHAGEAWADQGVLRAAYRDRYIAFVRALERKQPQARFILMGSEAFFPEIEQVAAALNAGDPGRAAAIEFTGLDHGGCDSHPSLRDHQALAALVEAAIERLPDAWRGRPARD